MQDVILLLLPGIWGRYILMAGEHWFHIDICQYQVHV